jgi:hypothetical protein
MTIRSNAMQEILGGKSRTSSTMPLSSKSLNTPSSPRRSRDRDASGHTSRKAASDSTRISTVRESTKLHEHKATIRLVPERSSRDKSEEHGTIYQQHFSGLEVCT